MRDVVIVTIGGLFLYWLCTHLIDVYFKRKEKFVDTLQDRVVQEKMKGSTDAKSE